MDSKRYIDIKNAEKRAKKEKEEKEKTFKLRYKSKYASKGLIK